MWEFLFGKRKKEVAKIDTVKEVSEELNENFEYRLRSELAWREEKRKEYANLIEFEAHLTSTGWEQKRSIWYNVGYPQLWISRRGDNFQLGMLYNYSGLEVFTKGDTGLIAKLEDALATYKRVTAEVGTN